MPWRSAGGSRSRGCHSVGYGDSRPGTQLAADPVDLARDAAQHGPFLRGDPDIDTTSSTRPPAQPRRGPRAPPDPGQRHIALPQSRRVFGSMTEAAAASLRRSIVDSASDPADSAPQRAILTIGSTAAALRSTLSACVAKMRSRDGMRGPHRGGVLQHRPARTGYCAATAAAVVRSQSFRPRRGLGMTLQASASSPVITTPRSSSGSAAQRSMPSAQLASRRQNRSRLASTPLSSPRIPHAPAARAPRRPAQSARSCLVVDVVGQGDHGLDIGTRDGLAAPDAAGDEPGPARRRSAPPPARAVPRRRAASPPTTPRPASARRVGRPARRPPPAGPG